HAHVGGLHLGVVGVDVVRHVTLAEGNRLEHDGELLRGVLDLDDVARLDEVARDVDATAVHAHVAVVDELAGGEDRRHELGAVDDGVQATLEQADEVLARVTTQADGLLVVAAELLLGNVAVVALELLLGAQLGAEVRQLALAALAVLAGAIFAAVHGALRAAPDVLAHTAIDLVLRRNSL